MFKNYLFVIIFLIKNIYLYIFFNIINFKIKFY